MKDHLMKKTKEALADEVFSLQERLNDRADFEGKAKKMIQLLCELGALPLDTKIDFATKIYPRLEITRYVGNTKGFKFEYCIRGGTASFDAPDFESGLNRLLFIA